MELQGIVAVITGGSSGLGEATARLLVAGGAKAVLLDLAEEKGQALAADLGESAIFCKTDVTDENSVKAAIEAAVNKFGAIHVAVNCAGVGFPAKVLGREGPMAMSHFNQVVQINLIGTMNVIRLAAEQMVKNEPNQDGEKGGGYQHCLSGRL